MLNNRDEARSNEPIVVLSLSKWGLRDEHNDHAMAFVPAEGAELFLLSAPAPFGKIDVHAIVEDVISALPRYIRHGYTIAIEPFVVSLGKCAVVQDSAGRRICILEKPKKASAPGFRH